MTPPLLLCPSPIVYNCVCVCLCDRLCLCADVLAPFIVFLLFCFFMCGCSFVLRRMPLFSGFARTVLCPMFPPPERGEFSLAQEFGQWN